MSANDYLLMDACRHTPVSERGGKCEECRLAAECDAAPLPKSVEEKVGEALAEAGGLTGD